MLKTLSDKRKNECQQCENEHSKGHQVFATMSSDEFKKGKKITPLRQEKGTVNKRY